MKKRERGKRIRLVPRPGLADKYANGSCIFIAP